MTARLIGRARLALLVCAISLMAMACATTSPDDGGDPNGNQQTPTSAAAAATGTPVQGETPSPTPEQAEQDVTGALFLQIASPATADVSVSQSSIEVAGFTTVDALVSINDTVVEVDGDGRFATSVSLEVGPNVVEVVASNADGEQYDEVLLVIYEPV